MKKKNNVFKSFFSNIKKKILKGKNKFTIVEAISFMTVTFALGMIIGGIIMYGKETYKSNVSSSLDEFIATYNDILENYYQPVDGEKLIGAGIDGMIKYLGDPYSLYLDKDSTEEFNMTLEGKYSGIGAEIKLLEDTGEIQIINIYENSPAAQAGLQKEDIIYKVNGEEIKGLSASEVSEKVKGEAGTEVNITIKRGEEYKDITIKRASIDLTSVTGEIIENNNKKIGYIYVSIFAENTDSQFQKELEKLEKENIDSLIIDLRQNSGGHLKTVTNMISMFLKKDEIIYKLKTKDNIEEFKDETEEHREYPIAIMIDEGSASASEVFTAALKEKYGAIVIGETSFGKGKVQKAYNLSNGALVKYTFQEWLTPNGNFIDQVGISPDIEVKYEYNPSETYDTQIKKAIEEMSK